MVDIREREYRGATAHGVGDGRACGWREGTWVSVPTRISRRRILALAGLEQRGLLVLMLVRVLVRVRIGRGDSLRRGRRACRHVRGIVHIGISSVHGHGRVMLVRRAGFSMQYREGGRLGARRLRPNGRGSRREGGLRAEVGARDGRGRANPGRRVGCRVRLMEVRERKRRRPVVQIQRTRRGRTVVGGVDVVRTPGVRLRDAGELQLFGGVWLRSGLLGCRVDLVDFCEAW